MELYFGVINDMSKEGMKEKKDLKEMEQKSPAICVVAYDLQGSPITEETAQRVVAAVEEATEKEKLAILFTRT